MAAIFDFVFELFGRLVQGRIKVYPLFCEYGETKCKCMPFFA